MVNFEKGFVESYLGQYCLHGSYISKIECDNLVDGFGNGGN
jgi:hypothetical protein